MSEVISKLHADLRHHVVDTEFGPWLKHPLVNKLLGMGMQANRRHANYIKFVNEIYHCKQECVAAALESGDWGRYVYTHEKYARVNALLALAEKLDHKTYWGLVGETWLSVECPSQSYDKWQEIWWCGRPYRMFSMPKEDRRVFRDLPDELKIYRGVGAKDEETAECFAEGFSWTLNRDKAEWFAQRNSVEGKSYLATMRVPKRDVIAYLDGRNEAEIVLVPESLGYPYEIALEALPTTN